MRIFKSIFDLIMFILGSVMLIYVFYTSLSISNTAFVCTVVAALSEALLFLALD